MKLHPEALVAHHRDAGPPREPPTPIPLEERLSPDGAGMQKQAHLARRVGGVALPLVRLAERTGTATADAGSRGQAQTPFGFWTPLLQGKDAKAGAAQRPIGRESTVRAHEATGFPG